MRAGHFRNWFRPRTPATYSAVQRTTYAAVVFALFPAMIWTGFAMSPAITSVLPGFVTVLGGQQSARTIHFIVACALLAFLVGHIAMVALAGFGRHVAAMIVGREVAG